MYDTSLKVKVVLDALRGEKTMAQLSNEYGVHANKIRQWRQLLLDELPQIFSDNSRKPGKATEKTIPELALYGQLNQLKVDLKWIKEELQRLQLEEIGMFLERGLFPGPNNGRKK